MSNPVVRIGEIEMVAIDDLHPHPDNTNDHSKAQIKQLAKIIEYQGWRYPIKVSLQTSFITSGHGRLLAAKLMGWTHVPVDFQEYDTDEMELLDVIADNAIATQAELDMAKINDLMVRIGPIDIELFGMADLKVDVSELPGIKEVKETQCPACGHKWVKGEKNEA